MNNCQSAKGPSTILDSLNIIFPGIEEILKAPHRPHPFSSNSSIFPSQLRETIEQEIRDMGLQTTPFTLTKVIQLYETKNSRHSTMIVGCTGSGKTASWRILQSSLSSLCRAGDPNFNIVRVWSWDHEAGDRDLSIRRAVEAGARMHRCQGGQCRPGGQCLDLRRPGREEREGQIQIP